MDFSEMMRQHSRREQETTPERKAVLARRPEFYAQALEMVKDIPPLTDEQAKEWGDNLVDFMCQSKERGAELIVLASALRDVTSQGTQYLEAILRSKLPEREKVLLAFILG